MRKVAKHHIGVSKATYNTVFERDGGRCALCFDDRAENLHLHHILTRAHKALINDPHNCIMLCSQHHRLVHQDMTYWQPILQGIVERREKRNGRKTYVCENNCVK